MVVTRERRNAVSMDGTRPAKTVAARFGNLKVRGCIEQFSRAAAHEFVLYDGIPEGKGQFRAQVT
ncbi:MAG: hypothetical protein ACRD51_19010 [Candidatus Acidiferrum sp.]